MNALNGISGEKQCNHGRQSFDVCIVGAGPSALTTLSALHSPYSLDGLTDRQLQRALQDLEKSPPQKKLRVCVVDTHDDWLVDWQRNFDTLDIRYLRSPVLAHPNMFDRDALLSYAVAQGRQNELLESGCFDIKNLMALGQLQVGLWKLPSTRLFVDFCRDLVSQLPHTFVGKAKVENIFKEDGIFRLTLNTESEIKAKSVVLALGSSGCPAVPFSIVDAPHWRHWNQPPQLQRQVCMNQPVLVIGGGLTAVQVALKVVKKGQRCVLCSKRPLHSQHFDISIEWFDQRSANRCMAEQFYDFSMEERMQALREARQGGSVPAMYMDRVRKAEALGLIECVVGHATYKQGKVSDGGMLVEISSTSGTHKSAKSVRVDDIILACGIQPDCTQIPLIAQIQSQFPIQLYDGLPCITEDLRWKAGLDLFVTGSLGALNIGPDAGNLMGMRRSAQLVANALECRRRLREKVLVNPFDAFLDDDDSTTEDELSTCSSCASNHD